MANVVLVIHLILALCLIGIVLLQRAEGGGLGIGGGGNVMTGRQAATALTKLTWLFAIAFIGTSITLTILAARDANSDSVIERLGTEAPAPEPAPILPPPPAPADSLLPPKPADGPALPPKPAE